MQMNLYILNDVLADCTEGMTVICAADVERCWEIFLDEFGQVEDRQWARVTVIENVNHSEGVVSYVYGGG
jgi:hypothetical protein